ncbi:hypothetical protein EJB05_04201, partial [Eragrostis curvula]
MAVVLLVSLPFVFFCIMICLRCYYYGKEKGREEMREAMGSQVHLMPPQPSPPVARGYPEPGEHEHPTGGAGKREDGEVPGLPPPGLVGALGLDAEALGPAQRVHLLEQVELEPLALELGDALAEQQRVLALPREQPLEHCLSVRLVSQRPEHGQGGEQ